ncbi:hypothetical protein [Bosea sp. NBC_00550]|uniref:hypothetical protein n=1 Tax=Bosea sp. NBC_00550 TaxID=2969621 RepID=UPI00223171C3|nr:hypothetical protein [Bosea sp. NBC_00550]UZF95519.1 hypothetical protein NWE53_29000 [Bosea sp. NBC_00550]
MAAIVLLPLSVGAVISIDQRKRRVSDQSRDPCSKVSERAATAIEAFRRLRDIQARASVTACSVLKDGVLIGESELLSAATVEEPRIKSEM